MGSQARARRGASRLIRPALLALVWWRLFGRELPHRFTSDQEHPLRLPGRTVFAGDREYFVREAGPADGTPVVLLHGLGGESLLEWYKVIPLLVARHRVLAFDLLNHGRSVKPRRQFEIADIADDLAAALDALGVGPVAVAGYSMGGLIAQDLAHRHPHRVSHLVLIATAAHLPPPRRRAVFVPAALVGRALERLTGLEVSRLRYYYLQRIGAVEARHARWFWDTTLDRDSNLYYESEFALLRFDGRDQATRLAVPTLMIVTEHDWFFPVDQQRDTAARIAGTQTLELSGTRHEVPWTHPEVIASAIDRFLTGRADPADGYFS